MSNTVTIASGVLQQLQDAAIEHQHALIEEAGELEEQSDEWIQLQVICSDLEDAITTAGRWLLDAREAAR